MSSYSTTRRSLEIELISAEGLKLNRKPLKKKTYCVVRIDEKFRVSKVDELGLSDYPIWKDKFDMEIPVNESVRFISIEVYYGKSGGTEKMVGCAKIPVTDFMGRFSPAGHLNFLSYRLRDDFGDKCGIVNVSILVKPDNNDKSLSPMDYIGCSSQAAAANNSQMWTSMTTSSMASTAGYGGGRVVTGVPVWCAYQRPS